jgi:hypothetical protein
MSHPTDDEVWQDFDREFLDFTKDARNLRLGLATDGFNPFSKKNTKYSMWHMFVVLYNLPPWECMEESNFMMALLILGPASPRKDFEFKEPMAATWDLAIYRSLHLRIAIAKNLSLAIQVTRIDWKVIIMQLGYKFDSYNLMHIQES